MINDWCWEIGSEKPTQLKVRDSLAHSKVTHLRTQGFIPFPDSSAHTHTYTYLYIYTHTHFDSSVHTGVWWVGVGGWAGVPTRSCSLALVM